MTTSTVTDTPIDNFPKQTSTKPFQANNPSNKFEPVIPKGSKGFDTVPTRKLAP
jgi:hypothetical protein